MEVTLTDKERDFLRRVVDRHYADLRAEIYRTDGSTFKEALKDEESLVRDLLAKLGS
jgi:hypothetical protein